jgi:glucose/mannose-6-phosphate isomerase
MKNYIGRFSLQLKEALEIGLLAKLTLYSNIRNVLISGLGGSGIGGTLVSELVSDNCIVPIVVNNSFFRR